MESGCRVLACSGSLEGGGSERQLWQLVTLLPRPRFAPEVYLQAKRGPYLERLPADVPVHAFDADHPNPARLFPGRIAWMQAIHLRRLVQSRQVDVVYDRTFHMTLLTGTALSARTPRVSVIVSPPSRDFAATEHRFAAIKRWMLRAAYRRASATVCVSHEVAEDAAIFYRLPRKSFFVLPNPVDSQRITEQAEEPLPTTASMLERPSWSSSIGHAEPLHVALIGRMTPEKNHLFALKVAAALAPTVQWHFVGDGPLRPMIEQYIEQHGLGASVHLHGYLANPYPLIKQVDLVFVPSSYEGYPNVALESLVLGVPLLMSNLGPTAREIIGEHSERGQLFPVDDQAAAVAAIQNRMNQPEAWRSRADAGRPWALREHAIAPWLESMMRLLEWAADSRGSRGTPFSSQQPTRSSS